MQPTLERLAHPAGIATLATTHQVGGMPTAQLAPSLQTQEVRIDIQREDTDGGVVGELSRGGCRPSCLRAWEPSRCWRPMVPQ